MKHIEIHMHYIQDLVHEGIINLQFFPSREQIVDIFTKTFIEHKFHSMCNHLGVKDIVSYQLLVLLFLHTLYFEGGSFP
jgi:hypothetical protein